MRNEGHDEKKLFTPANYPALREFLPAYLHQDFMQEYGSAAEAAKAFLADASGDEGEDVKNEWRQLRKSFAAQPFSEFQGALHKLGSAWRPQSEAALKDFDEILSSSSS
jgi:hypothetical protein